jgi:copper/silver efflux system protein
MLERLIDGSGRNPFLIVLLTLLLCAVGIHALRQTPLDALPDLSDVQVIVFTEYPGQAPQVVEDQVTYPLTTSLLSVPGARVVRGFSMFGASYVYVIFEDGTDIYWARSRVLEYLNTAASRLPAGVSPRMGPDATGVGWVYQYALLGKEQSLGELRSLQDWYIRYPLTQSHGVSEVASIGGFVNEFQVVLDPHRLAAYGIEFAKVGEVIAASNRDVGGRVIEMAEKEYMVRGRGYLQGVADIEALTLGQDKGTPIRIADVGRVELVPAARRGVAELNGEGEVASGIVMARFGENALDVIAGVKAKIAEMAPGLPEGTQIVPVYDRSELIQEAIDTLKRTLLEESLIVAFVCALFLLHARSALVAIITLPLGILMAFIGMQALGVGSNIMSLGGIAIAIGAMVDASIVMIENAHKHLERFDAKAQKAKAEGHPMLALPEKARVEVILTACKEVGPALFFSLLIITVSFLPVFALEGQEGRLFSPLALTKTFAMAGAAFLSLTLIPVLMLFFVRGRILPENKNPLNRGLIALYRPVIAAVLRFRWTTLGLAMVAMAATLYPAKELGSEFMPTLNEGSLFYMPASIPGMSVTEASRLLAITNRIIKTFPEVKSVYGKAGRAESATDPAPLEMFETVINLKPRSQWREGMTMDALIAEMDAALRFPGLANSWTMPIKARIDMLSTGIRTPVGIKVFGRTLDDIEQVARQVEQALKAVPSVTSAYAERVTGGLYLDIEPRTEALARLGLSADDVQKAVSMALGGESVSTAVLGRERYEITVRYPRALREDPERMRREIWIPTANGVIPLGQVADVRIRNGPPSVRTENAMLVGYVYVDTRESDLGGFVREAQAAVANAVRFPPGSYLTWSGQFEYMERAKEKLAWVIPLTVVLIFLLLYLNFRRLTETIIVMSSVPFALIGGIWLMWWLDYNLSVAVAVGFIALAGVAAETGVIMLMYLDHAWKALSERCVHENRSPTREELHAAVMAGAVERVRPKMMTTLTVIVGLLPIMWSTGAGSEIMQRIAAPMLGGMISSTLLTLIVIPALYAVAKGVGLEKGHQRAGLKANDAQ